MRLFLGFTLLLLALAGVARVEARQNSSNSRQQPAEETLVTLEKQVWSLIKQRDLKTYAGLMAEDYMEIFPEGDTHTKAEILKFFEEEFVLKDYSLEGFRVVMLNAEAGLVVYKADVRGVNKGKDEVYRVSCVSGWARRGGKWLNVFYQENFIKPPAAQSTRTPGRGVPHARAGERLVAAAAGGM